MKRIKSYKWSSFSISLDISVWSKVLSKRIARSISNKSYMFKNAWFDSNVSHVACVGFYVSWALRWIFCSMAKYSVSLYMVNFSKEISAGGFRASPVWSILWCSLGTCRQAVSGYCCKCLGPNKCLRLKQLKQSSLFTFVMNYKQLRCITANRHSVRTEFAFWAFDQTCLGSLNPKQAKQRYTTILFKF